MRIYKTTDRIEVKIEDISIFISPLNQHQKSNLQASMIKASKGDMEEAMNAVLKAMKMSIKDIKGVTSSDEQGKDVPYKLEFVGEELSDECANDLLNLPISQKISSVCSQLIGGVPDQIIDNMGNPVDGISIVKSKVEKARKK